MTLNARLALVTVAALGLLVGNAAGCGHKVASTADAPAAKDAATQQEKISSALRRAVEFLEQRQSADGAWRSDVYAPFRAGDALTPFVLAALQSLPEHVRPRAEIDRGLAYLQGFIGHDGSIQVPQPGVSYPVYIASGAIMALGDRQDAAAVAAREAWLKYLREQQLNESNGWQSDDLYYGGWSYSLERPRKPADGTPLNPLAEPNLSATVFALEALRAAGTAPTAAEIQRALKFVLRCQNFAAAGAKSETFDDGGFYYVLTDAVRNKAGSAGQDAEGHERFASYGSATADGLRALLLGGETHESPRVQAACQWLKQRFSAEHQPGTFEVDVARDSVYFYYVQSMALLLDRHRVELENAGIPVRMWADALAKELLKRQRGDGSWVNAAVEVREDDPIVATSLAITALAACDRILAASSTDH